MKRLLGSFVFLIAGMFIFTACGSSSTTQTDYTNASLLVKGSELDVNASNQVIIDVRKASDYAAGHITNAINLGTSAIDSSYDLQDTSTVAATLGAAGVSSTARIVVYGGDVDSSAGRVFWALEYLGATDVHILDGGYTKWIADGRAVVADATVLPAATFTASVDSSRNATKEEILANYSDTANYSLIDSRDAADYAAGRIPNAINMLTGDFLNSDKTVLSYANLKTLLDSKGITNGKSVVTYCYVGYRSGQEYFILRLMGFNVKNYEGSWSEWSADASLPTES